jgi:hypothetical protein
MIQIIRNKHHISRQGDLVAGVTCGPLPDMVVEQTFLIEPDGGLLVPWMMPSAGPLVRAVWETLSDDDFPVSNTTENLYCG